MTMITVAQIRGMICKLPAAAGAIADKVRQAEPSGAEAMRAGQGWGRPAWPISL